MFNVKNKNFINTQDWSKEELDYVLTLAEDMKRNGWRKTVEGKTLAMLFFNPSLRTRTSFEVAMYQLGGHAITLQPGKDAWGIEIKEGVKMDGDAEEHIKEATNVLSRFCDAIAVRSFPKFQNWDEDKRDSTLATICKWSSKPVINMETIRHPCQELALMMAIRSHFNNRQEKKKFLLTWTYHPKPLNMAVANSAAMISTRYGMNLTILCPKGYDLDKTFIDIASKNAVAYGGKVTVTDDIRLAYSGADFVYAKSWGSLEYYGRWDEEKKIRDGQKHFIVDSDKMKLTNNAFFSHCLPLRRNIKATDEVVDSKNSLIYEEAENRLHTERALLSAILGNNG
ncbi:MAG: acetylornithine carbamoyltransferase [Candidatus Schekmanbacteria bacterium RBG_16_38_10]|uniref:Acetylornithine carbamoyltransferase n=1 Tax=Candidatus Schekmanbacteria bacterium RBG_16_38_10 TaxID=1817879 RepID=A0A1F7S2S8_9BACT|nr:MAG: acetylornithine carbamoyltransferase [Candidatus Schekmanbacteria bacterium RBG_16_38_10]